MRVVRAEAGVEPGRRQTLNRDCFGERRNNTMNGRERITAVVNKQPFDKLAWTTLVDGNTLNALPDEMREMSGIDFYRHLDCDIFLLNGWGLETNFSSPALAWPEDLTTSSRQENGKTIRQMKTPEGTLTTIFRGGHPIKPPVTSLKEVNLYRRIWEDAQFVERDDSQAYEEINSIIGDDGIATRFWGPSTIPRLLEFDTGMQNFYYLLCDHPQEMEALINAIHERELEAFEILARGPCDVIILCENTSTYYISPDVYRKYNGPHVRDFVDIAHAAGKTAIIHMCGHVKNILDQIKDTGLDGIHALTPPPTGDTPWELALDVMGEDLIIIGALDPSIFVSGPVEQIAPALDELYTPRLRRANFILCPGADGIRAPLERFQAVADWMNRNGR